MGYGLKSNVCIHARNMKNSRALTTTISFIREEVNDNNEENDFCFIKNSNNSLNF